MAVFTEGLSHTEGFGRHNYISIVTQTQIFDPNTYGVILSRASVSAGGPGEELHVGLAGESDAFVKVEEDPDGSKATISIINLPPGSLTTDVAAMEALGTPDNTVITHIAKDSTAFSRSVVLANGRREVVTATISHFS